MFKLEDDVRISNVSSLSQDPHLSDGAFEIIKESNYTGKVTKIEDDIYFVGFKNSRGWVTQGFKVDEVKEVD